MIPEVVDGYAETHAIGHSPVRSPVTGQSSGFARAAGTRLFGVD